MLVPKLPKLNRHRNKSGLQYTFWLGASNFRWRVIAARSVDFKFRTVSMDAVGIAMCFSHLGVFLMSVKPLTTENTKNKTLPKICKITVASTASDSNTLRMAAEEILRRESHHLGTTVF